MHDIYEITGANTTRTFEQVDLDTSAACAQISIKHVQAGLQKLLSMQAILTYAGSIMYSPAACSLQFLES